MGPLSQTAAERNVADPAIATRPECDLALDLPHVSISLVVHALHYVESRATARAAVQALPAPRSRTITGPPDPSDARSWASDSETARVKVAYMYLHTYQLRHIQTDGRISRMEL